jgi:response regulator RpfG family c-di-GMP phosphodiesterase
MTGQLSQSYDEINLLYRFSHVLRPDESFAKAAHRLLEETADLLEQRLLIFCQPDEDHIEWSAGSRSGFPDVLHWLTGNWDALEAIQTEFTRKLRGRESRNSARHASVVQGPDGPVHYVICPVRVRSEMTGYVGVFRVEGELPIETGELRLLEALAEELSNVATTRQLYQELREMLFNTVRSLVAAIDAKDVYTRGHSERVYLYSMKIGEHMGLSADDMQILSWASMLHDVGKIGISGEILNKPAKLTEEEFAEIKTHPAKGCLVLAPIPQLAATIPAIRHHHERYDGRGYPDGLSGEAIPLIARVIAVADTFDAIYSSRAYRAARSLDWAVEEIRRCSGTQFDPDVAAAFLELLEGGALDEIKGREPEQPAA